MKASVSLGRWFGVPVGLHYSWFIVAWLITMSLGLQLEFQNPTWTMAVVWTTATITALLFFIGLLLHELSHAAVARLHGIPVRGITLFALGGVARIERDAASPGLEFAIAIAGPVASVVIGGVCDAAAALLGWSAGAPAPSPLAALLGWLGYINIALALFNLIPGFPLDGGRVFRAGVWAVTKDADRATRIAAGTGQAIAIAFILFGLTVVFVRSDFGGLWLAFIGWFLLEAARSNYVASQVLARLRGLSVADLMVRDCADVDPDRTVQEFVDHELVPNPGACFVVRRSGQPIGLVSAEDVARTPPGRRSALTVSDVIQPIDADHSVTPEMPASAALELMNRRHVTELPVLDHGHLEGVVAQMHILRRLRLQAALRG